MYFVVKVKLVTSYAILNWKLHWVVKTKSDEAVGELLMPWKACAAGRRACRAVLCPQQGHHCSRREHPLSSQVLCPVLRLLAQCSEKRWKLSQRRFHLESSELTSSLGSKLNQSDVIFPFLWSYRLRIPILLPFMDFFLWNVDRLFGNSHEKEVFLTWISWPKI